MAVVTAHGGIHQQERFFQVVAVRGVLRVTPDALAAALRNVGSMSFCSCAAGSTSEEHPNVALTSSAGKQILDRGCQAVIAPPWPLDSRVPSHWLPALRAVVKG